MYCYPITFCRIDNYPVTGASRVLIGFLEVTGKSSLTVTEARFKVTNCAFSPNVGYSEVLVNPVANTPAS